MIPPPWCCCYCCWRLCCCCCCSCYAAINANALVFVPNFKWLSGYSIVIDIDI